MKDCLYSEFGFFNTEVVRSSKEGDFLTSPEVSEYFGEIIANFINKKIHEGDIIEVGAGTGSLAQEIDKYTNKDLFLLESSSTALKILNQKNFITAEKPEIFSDKKIDIVYMNEVLAQYRIRKGAITNNILHNRTSFTNINNQTRLIYRIRSKQRVNL